MPTNWKDSDVAAVTTWITLLHLGQLNNTFKKSQGTKMEELTFWVHADSGAMRENNIKSLSIQLDNYFIKLRGAIYEDSVDREQALDGIRDALRDASNTVENLADVCNEKYKFWGEDEENEIE